jgi:transposase-like protein
MDQALTAFREAADRENRHRRVRRRYSPTLQQQAVEYWQQRRRHEGVRAIAAAMGVSVTTLQRWTRGIAARSRFRRVAVRHLAPAAVGPVPVVITMTADGPRVEGLTVETAARLLTLLR